jgi:hypothetical protein
MNGYKSKAGVVQLGGFQCIEGCTLRQIEASHSADPPTSQQHQGLQIQPMDNSVTSSALDKEQTALRTDLVCHTFTLACSLTMKPANDITAILYLAMFKLK